jgi:hypothetical protein
MLIQGFFAFALSLKETLAGTACDATGQEKCHFCLIPPLSWLHAIRRQW